MRYRGIFGRYQHGSTNITSSHHTDALNAHAVAHTVTQASESFIKGGYFNRQDAKVDKMSHVG